MINNVSKYYIWVYIDMAISHNQGRVQRKGGPQCVCVCVGGGGVLGLSTKMKSRISLISLDCL